MKTSASQFNVMVTFMEQHGDLSKLSSHARGRLANLKHWDDLTNILNSDGSGDTKTTERWKKVWSDFKNNTKKKAARLQKAACGTGGGTATFAKLTDLEHRVLNVVGAQVATGLPVEEAGLPQMQQRSASMTLEVTLNSTPIPFTQFTENAPVTINIATPQPESQIRAISSPPHAFIKEEVHNSFLGDEPRPSTPHFTPAQSPPEPEVEGAGMLTLMRPTSQIHVVRAEPALSGQTTTRRARVTRIRGSPRRRVRPTHTEQATQHFLQAEKFRRKFKLQQHRDYMDMRREQNRIREMEVETQRDWQAVGLRALDILDKLVNKYCNN